MASSKVQRGIIVCGSSVGACIIANNVPGVQTCFYHDTYAEIPGMDAKDKNIDISVSGDLLTINGEKKQEREEK